MIFPTGILLDFLKLLFTYTEGNELNENVVDNGNQVFHYCSVKYIQEQIYSEPRVNRVDLDTSV
jgi:hypothetical protein